MLTDKQKEIVVKQILSVLDGWKINDAFDALEYAKGYICDFTEIKLPEKIAIKKTQGSYAKAKAEGLI